MLPKTPDMELTHARLMPLANLPLGSMSHALVVLVIAGQTTKTFKLSHHKTKPMSRYVGFHSHLVALEKLLEALNTHCNLITQS